VIVNGITVVISGSNENYGGMSIAWCTKISSKYLIISIPSHAKCTKRLIEDEQFSLSVLSNKQVDIAKMFGGSAQKEELTKKAGVVTAGKSGIPVIAACAASYYCKVISCESVEKQIVVTARIQDMQESPELEALVYKKEDFFS